jgi:hypothetical protein
MKIGIAVLTSMQVVLFSLAVLAVFFLLFFVFFLAWWMSRREVSLSPYSGMPLRSATSLSYYSIEKVVRYLYQMHQYDNRIFEIKKAALCRETGRVFPDCLTWYDVIKIDWSFIQKRHSGSYVSWGSLTGAQKEAVRAIHESLDNFQTEYSSSTPSPRHVEQKYALEKPGPLYVDINTGILVGWQCVPDTDLEVLIVQKPTEIITLTLPQDQQNKKKG